MKIFVCMKEVVSRESRLQLSADSKWVDESVVSFEISESDEYALEEALKIKETHGGEVVLVTLGSERAEKIMRKGLAKGADRGILIQDESKAAASPYSIGSVLSSVIHQEEYDLILTGSYSDDLSYAQTGAVVAELLGVPHVSLVMEVEVFPEEKRFVVLREMESGWFEKVEVSGPALLCVQPGISQIRFASLKGIMQAKKKEIRKVSLDEISGEWRDAPSIEVIRLYVPDQEPKGEIFEGDAETVVGELLQRLRNEAKVL